jgi:hypothetical protein
MKNLTSDDPFPPNIVYSLWAKGGNSFESSIHLLTTCDVFDEGGDGGSVVNLSLQFFIGHYDVGHTLTPVQ